MLLTVHVHIYGRSFCLLTQTLAYTELYSTNYGQMLIVLLFIPWLSA